MKKYALLAITKRGYQLANKIASVLPGSTVLQKEQGEKISELLAAHWNRFDGFLCVMAAGVVVRSIAPLLSSKEHDPCVLVADEKGKNVVSLLSGHLGGGNALTLQVAEILGSNPVITTASDTLGLVSLDLWAEANNLVPPPKELLTQLSARLVNSGQLLLYSDVEIAAIPKSLKEVNEPGEADLIISHRLYEDLTCSFFRPKNLIIGTGCNRGTPVSEFNTALTQLFSDLAVSQQSVRNLASIDKKNDEEGLLQFGALHDWKIEFFSKDQLNKLHNLEISFAALKAVGAIGVAEPASLLSAKSNILLSRKRKWKNITMAIAQAPFILSEQDQAPSNT